MRIFLFICSLFIVFPTLANSEERENQLIIFAASSLYPALDGVAELYTQVHDIKITVSYASSATLARQIAAGAPAGIFLSANANWINWLRTERPTQGAIEVPFLSNQLVLVGNKDLDSDVTDVTEIIEQLGDDQRLSIGDPISTPLGQYSQQALQHFHIWSNLENQLAPSRSAMSALRLVETRATPLGITYLNLAKQSPAISILYYFPPESYDTINYVALATGSMSPAIANDFINFLSSQTAQNIFQSAGFTPIAPKD